MGLAERIAQRWLEARQKELVQYKGRSYYLMWEGPTRYGDRAKLQFMDGTKEFWVDADRITRDRGSSRGPSRRGPEWPARGSDCPVCYGHHSYAPCGYPGCSPNYCDECDGGGRYCNG